ncbi:acetyl-CoA carboxylase biotin carboxyl carrier protein subunit, partial [uncultured Leifsonia sp.]|uniref:acetyl-CoA carboxylase biotin carboxyl carrier protein subunit n=1 Tax=uncultured Leifsonia sp. TaxID=340359 RepID=UPI0028D48ABF
ASRVADALAALDRAEAAAHPELRSPMPGTVVAVPVADGADVRAGDTVAVVEAMKMEHRLLAPVSGVVRLSVGPGDLVTLDQLVATVDAEDADAPDTPDAADVPATPAQNVPPAPAADLPEPTRSAELHRTVTTTDRNLP